MVRAHRELRHEAIPRTGDGVDLPAWASAGPRQAYPLGRDFHRMKAAVEQGGALGEGPSDFAGLAQGARGIGNGQAHSALFGLEDFARDIVGGIENIGWLRQGRGAGQGSGCARRGGC